MFEPNEEPHFELIECQRWITSANQTYTILADQVSQIMITSKIKDTEKYYYLKCILMLPEKEKIITLARYTSKVLLIKEKRRLINWLTATNISDTEFRCFPESIERLHITSKDFYHYEEGGT